MLKGGTGLLARTLNARFTTDIDLTSASGDADRAVEALMKASQLDLGDHLSFTHVSTNNTSAARARPGKTLFEVKFQAALGVQNQQVLKVEFALSDQPLEKVDSQLPQISWQVGGIEPTLWSLLPIPLQIADKVAATFENHGGNGSSRPKDLVDILIIAHEFKVEKGQLRAAISNELKRRGISQKTELVLPGSWSRTYPKVASKSSLPIRYHDSSFARELASTFLDLANLEEDTATWSPVSLSWNTPGVTLIA